MAFVHMIAWVVCNFTLNEMLCLLSRNHAFANDFNMVASL